MKGAHLKTEAAQSLVRGWENERAMHAEVERALARSLDEQNERLAAERERRVGAENRVFGLKARLWFAKAVARVG